MGSWLSSQTPPSLPEKSPTSQPRHFPYHNLPVPAEASTTPEDSADWYTNFYEKASVALHKDGQSLIICRPSWRAGGFPLFEGDDGVGDAWPVHHIEKVYKKLGGDHARVVRHIETLSDGSLVVEKLYPGPLNDITLPVLRVPMQASIRTNTVSHNDGILLALYYRWALQILSAFKHLHSHGVLIRVFSSPLVWVRSDFSLAITGFLSAEIEGDEEFYDEDGCGGNESYTYDDSAVAGCAMEDIFCWAMFIWRIMTNEHSSQSHWGRGELWEPFSPLDEGPTGDDRYEIVSERAGADMWQELEEERLGNVILRAWKGGFKSVDEVVDEVREMARKVGLRVEGDEIDVGRKWEEVFEVVQEGRGREIRFRTLEKETLVADSS